MEDIERFEKIKKFGFTDYEAKCYLALFEKDSLSVSEIVAIAGVPQANVYGTMEKLLARGLCVLLPGKMKRFAATNPKAFREKSLESINNTMNSLNDLSDELDSLYKTSRSNRSPLDSMEVIKNYPQLLRRFISLGARAQKDVVQFIKPPFVYQGESQKISKAFIVEMEKANDDLIERNVESRSIWDLSAKDHLLDFARGINYPPRFLQDKVADELPIKMIVFDSRIVLYNLVDDVSSRPSVTSLITEHPDLANAFVKLFEFYWKNAMTIGEFLEREGVDIGAGEKKKRNI